MWPVKIIVAFGILHLASADPFRLFKRGQWDGSPAEVYLNSMCLPLVTKAIYGADNITEIDASLANSPFPCEQFQWIEGACMANGTTEVDFLAEQECLCGGAAWDALTGCYNCFLSHGDPRNSSEQISSYISSLSAAECTPTSPYQPFTNLLPPRQTPTFPFSDMWPSLSLVNDRFPNDTAWSNYWTPTATNKLGAITGSATGRLTSWTNSDYVSFTPVSSPTSPTITSRASVGSTTTSGSSVGSTTTSATKNIGAVKEVRASKSVLLVILGGAVIL